MSVAMPKVLESDADAWALRISACWRRSIESIFETGRLLIDAKERLPHGEFGFMLENKLPFGERQAQMLMAIASDIRLSNPQCIALLPPSWGTIYDLTRLNDDVLERGFREKIIRPDMERADVVQLRPASHQITQESQSESNQRQDGYGTEGAHADGVASRPDAGRSASTTSENLDVTAGETAPNSTMPGGGLAIAHRRLEDADSLDFFPTPPWATRALIECVFAHLERKGHCQFQTAWEPACGEGHMSEVLAEYFKVVQTSDKFDYGKGYVVTDFLACTVSVNVDWIITNPPFNDSADFVLQGLALAGAGVAMFVRLSWLESVGRYEKIFRDHPPTLVSIFTERVPLHKGRWEEDGTTMTAYMWLVWIKGAEPRAPFWIPPGQREALTKPDDGKRFGKQPQGEAA